MTVITLGVADLAIVVIDRSRPMTSEDVGILAETASQPRVSLIDDPLCAVTPGGYSIDVG